MPEVNIDNEGMIIDEKKAKKKLDPARLVVWLVFALYFLNIAVNRPYWTFLDNVNLPLHESGHTVFAIFGNTFITILGGTIMELLIPLTFAAYFYFTYQKFSASLVMLWLGEAVISVSIYMDDAIDRALPLITDDPSTHDWYNMLSMLGILPMAHTLAGAARWLGVFVILYGIVWGFKCCWKEEETFAI